MVSTEPCSTPTDTLDLLNETRPRRDGVERNHGNRTDDSINKEQEEFQTERDGEAKVRDSRFGGTDRKPSVTLVRTPAVPHLMGKMIREVKPLVIIQQTGDDFVVTVKTPLRTNTNSFTFGKESDFTTMDGAKTRAIVKMVDGKVIIETEKVTHMREIQGEEMVEVCSWTHTEHQSTLLWGITQTCDPESSTA
ncbi:hypothetical protein QTP70_029661, partial [Hemibagrus guttatus]